jgi:hypothetical protein
MSGLGARAFGVMSRAYGVDRALCRAPAVGVIPTLLHGTSCKSRATPARRSSRPCNPLRAFVTSPFRGARQGLRMDRSNRAASLATASSTARALRRPSGRRHYEDDVDRLTASELLGELRDRSVDPGPVGGINRPNIERSARW